MWGIIKLKKVILAFTSLKCEDVIGDFLLEQYGLKLRVKYRVLQKSFLILSVVKEFANAASSSQDPTLFPF